MASLKNRKLLDKIEAKLNFKFNNRSLLQQALTHKSFPNENRELNLKDNERLEFLGDSVLSLTISTHIFKEYPDFPEGKLAKMRAFLVSAPTLATKARQLELGSYILMGKGEEMTGGRKRDSILADTLEALIGALYIDRDFEQASQFILDLFSADINKV
ncbi:MAG: ribonuclease III, partial [Bacillota bacterium]